MRFVFLTDVDSTNSEARRRVVAGETGPIWIAAERQLSGRGRGGRDWSSPSGNLFCTGLYPLKDGVTAAGQLSFVAALAVYDALAAYVPDETLSIKWPNDVLIGGAKVSGILLETVAHAGQHFVLVGIGINLISHPADTPYPATDVLSHMAAADLDVPEPLMTGPQPMLALLSARFDHWQNVRAQEGFDPVREVWTARAAGLSGPMTVRLLRETLIGTASGLGANGELRLCLPDGTMRDIHAGDVFFGSHSQRKDT